MEEPGPPEVRCVAQIPEKALGSSFLFGDSAPPVPPRDAAPLQGGLDPKILLLSDEEIKNNASVYFDIFKDIPYIFNLGHGLLPETDPDKVDMLVKFYREHK